MRCISEAMMIVESLWYYPIKGLKGTRLSSVSLGVGRHFPFDRRFAITNGHPRHKDAEPGAWHRKAFFLQLMEHERLAELECHFLGDELVLHHGGREVLRVDIKQPGDIDRVNAFFDEFIGDGIHGQPRLVRISEGAYTDTPDPWISIGGTASVERFAEATGTQPNAARFRLNIMLSGAEPFVELDLVGKKVRIGEAEMHIIEPVGRCAAIDVDPANAKRGPHLVPHMKKAFGHTDLGIFAGVIKGGNVAPGDRLEVLGDSSDD